APQKLNDPKDPGVRDRVIDAWRTLGARQEARKEAERIQALIAKKGLTFKGAEEEKADTFNPIFTELAKEHPDWGKPFRRENVMRFVSADVAHIGAETFEPYKPPTDKIEHPRSDLVDKLMALQKPGDSTTTRDQPEANFFVVVLAARAEPSLETFFEEY